MSSTPAVTWTSDAGTGPGNVPASHSSPLIGHKDVFLAPDWLTVPALTPLVLDGLWKCFTRPTGAAWAACTKCWAQLRHPFRLISRARVNNSANQRPVPALLTNQGLFRSRILSMVAEIWDMERFVRTDNTHGKPQWAAVPSFFSLLSLVSISIGNNLIMSRHFVVNYIPVTGQHFIAHILI